MTIDNPRGTLAPRLHQVAADFVREEEAQRRHLVVYLSGAHAYGFPSPDSDLDIKAVHAEPARRLLGLAAPPAHASRMAVVSGVEVDYTSNELGPVLAGVLAGNGNYVERFLGDLVLLATAELEELRPLVRGALSRRVHRHYHGFAAQQRRAFEGSPAPTAKTLLYVLRTALTGLHLLRSGQLATDVSMLLDEHGLGEGHELIKIKRSGERAELPAEAVAHWRSRLDRLFGELDAARDRSPLPEEPASVAAIDAWLVDYRMRTV